MDRTRTTATMELVGDDLSDSSTFGRVLDQFFSNDRPRFCPPERAWAPPTDVYETRQSVVIRMELAGVRREDLDIQVNGNYLVVRGRRAEQHPLKKENYHQMEIHYGSFARVFRMPNKMVLKDVAAEIENGFLTLTVPKGEYPAEIRINIE